MAAGTGVLGGTLPGKDATGPQDDSLIPRSGRGP